MAHYRGRSDGAPASRLVLVVLAILCTSLQLDAHDVIVEQIVRMVVAPGIDRLAVRVEVPATLLNDAGLPKLASGQVDPTVDDAGLQVVAADVARNLDFRANEAPLRMIKTAARLASNNQSVDVEITYAPIGSPMGLSARLNAFQGAPLQPPRTDVSYQPSSGAPRLLSVSGPPVRISFDPELGDVFRRFATQAFDVVFAGGGHLLFLIGLLLPMRPARESVRLIATLLAAQAVGILLSTTVAITGPLLVTADMIAWSIVVAAAVSAIGNAPMSVLSALSGVFGLLGGIVLGASFSGALQLSGSHTAAALLTFMLVSVAAEVWLAAVMLATRHWLDRVMEHQVAAIVVAAAIVAHVAVHRVLARANELPRAESFASTHAVLCLVLGWTFVMVVVAFSRLVRGAPAVGDHAGSSGATF
jgi:hypothetical protein